MPKPPDVVILLAKKVDAVPWSWKIYDDRIVIVMKDGRKLSFDKPADKPKPTRRTATKKTSGK